MQEGMEPTTALVIVSVPQPFPIALNFMKRSCHSETVMPKPIKPNQLKNENKTIRTGKQRNNELYLRGTTNNCP